MFPFKVLQKLIFTPFNYELDAMCKRRDRSFEGECRDIEVKANELSERKAITQQKSHELGMLLIAAITEHYSPFEQDRVRNGIVRVMEYLATESKLFPDLDNENIWYADECNLIKLAKELGLGEESASDSNKLNYTNRYLELTASDLVQIFLSFSKEALLDEYKFGTDVDGWIKYLLRQTLKSRQLARKQRRQNNAFWFSPANI